MLEISLLQNIILPSNDAIAVNAVAIVRIWKNKTIVALVPLGNIT